MEKYTAYNKTTTQISTMKLIEQEEERIIKLEGQYKIINSQKQKGKESIQMNE